MAAAAGITFEQAKARAIKNIQASTAAEDDILPGCAPEFYTYEGGYHFLVPPEGYEPYRPKDIRDAADDIETIEEYIDDLYENPCNPGDPSRRSREARQALLDLWKGNCTLYDKDWVRSSLHQPSDMRRKLTGRGGQMRDGAGIYRASQPPRLSSRVIRKLTSPPTFS